MNTLGWTSDFILSDCTADYGVLGRKHFFFFFFFLCLSSNFPYRVSRKLRDFQGNRNRNDWMLYTRLLHVKTTWAISFQSSTKVKKSLSNFSPNSQITISPSSAQPTPSSSTHKTGEIIEQWRTNRLWSNDRSLSEIDCLASIMLGDH